MFDTKRVGERIALLRKERGMTQDALAERLGISAQAVSKWENGHSLPDTALLPVLSRLLDCTIDTLLMPSCLQILEAVYTDGETRHTATARLGKYIEADRLDITVDDRTLMCDGNSDRPWFLLVKYQNPVGIRYASARAGDNLVLDPETPGYPPIDADEGKPMRIVDAFYGNGEHAYNAMSKIRHFEFFRPNRYHANHEAFPSNPMVTGPEYLSILYLNGTGLHVSVCGENESLAVTPDGADLVRELQVPKGSVINGVEALAWNKGMDCSWAGALTVALRAMGHMRDMSLEDAYTRVMGVSGACYRLAFSSPTWDYSSVDGLVAYNYAFPGYKAFGYEPLFADRVEKKDREAERDKIVRSLAANRPVLAINLRVAPEWGVVTGFDEADNALLCRTYFDKDVIDKEFDGADRYLPVDNWPFIITRFGRATGVPSDGDNLMDSLRVMIECANIPGARGYSMGYNAYRTWAADLRDGERFRVDDPTLWRLYSVNHFCMMALADARRCAWKYIHGEAQGYGGRKGELLHGIADQFRQVYEAVAGVYVKLHDLCPSDAGKARTLWPESLRLEQAGVLDAACACEGKAEGLAKEFLES